MKSYFYLTKQIGLSDFPGNKSWTSNYKLAVNGHIIATELKVQVKIAWPDYVFSKAYKLMQLTDLKEYIKTNNHLPEIASSDQVTAENGFDLGKSNIMLLKKIEELTLYLIELNEKINELENKLHN